HDPVHHRALHSFPTRRSSDLEIVERFDFARRLFSTFGGNPVAARAALAVLEVIDDERLVPHAGRVGELLRERLGELREGHPSVVDRKSTRLNSSHVSISYAVF